MEGLERSRNNNVEDKGLLEIVMRIHDFPLLASRGLKSEMRHGISSKYYKHFIAYLPAIQYREENAARF